MNNIPRNEHPRPDRHRDSWLSLNGTWDFEIDNALVGEGKKFFERTSLDGKITVPFCPESRLSGVAHTDFMNAVWYRRDLDIPADWAGKNVILHIDACDYETTVYVNGKKVGTHRGGYTSFQFDITKYLAAEGNYVTICAKDDVRSDKQVAGKQSQRFGSYGCYYREFAISHRCIAKPKRALHLLVRASIGGTWCRGNRNRNFQLTIKVII